MEIVSDLIDIDMSDRDEDCSRSANDGAWKVLVVDDEEEVHRLTQMVLEDYTFEARRLEVLTAFTGKDAVRIMAEEEGIALVMLDVVMETDDAGLKVVRHIREILNNDIVQIVLRTGQPGLAPPQEIIAEYNINSYNSKVELTAQKIFTIVTASLRAYKLASSLDLANRKLKEELAQRKKVEREVQKLNEFQKSVIDNTIFWLSVFDQTENVVVWNKAAENISGYSFDEMKQNGLNWEVLYPGKDNVERLRSDFRERLQHTDHVDDYDVEITRKDGAKRVMSWSFRRYTDKNGYFTGSILLGRDVTELKKLEGQFLQAQKMEAVGRLAGGVAHDFNNMLTVIRGHCELLMVKLRPNDPVFEKIEQVDRAAERAESLTRQILSFSRHRLIKPVSVDIKKIIDGMKDMFERLVPDSIDIIFRFDRQQCFIKADPGQMEQVLMNLVVNACDAMPDGGEISIIIERGGKSPTDETPCIRIIVKDTGLGMDDEVQGNMFEPFFTTKEKGKGTGLGLSTVYGIIKQNNGAINVESGVGQGATFAITFLEETTDTVEVVRHQPDYSHGLHGDETILVVEDQQEVLAMTSESLRYYGYKVLEAQNAGSALLICEKYGVDIDIMLTDVRMDLMDGTQLAQRVHPLYPEIRILFMSGYAENNPDQAQVVEPGVNFIQKPFVISNLLMMIRDSMESPAPLNIHNFS